MPTNSNRPLQQTLSLENGAKVKARFTSQSAEYEALWVRGTTDVYIIGAKAGQTMSVTIQAEKKKNVPNSEEDAGFDVFNAKNNELIGDGGESWSGKLPENGEYAISVVGDHGNTAYKLKITVR